MPTDRDILQLLSEIPERLDGDLSLDALAARAGWSPFHFHRAFCAVTGETPKHYTQRLRLERAAGRLLTTTDSIVTIATASGFASHEVFTRAFRRHFGCTPARYRERGRLESPGARLAHAATTTAAGPCIGLFHMPLAGPARLRQARSGLHEFSRRRAMPMLSIERRDVATQPILFTRLRCARSELSQAIGEGVGKVYLHAQQSGIALDGHPFTRYPSVGPGLMTIEVGFRVAAGAQGSGDIEAGELPAGPAIVATHGGAYDSLTDTYVAAERWMEQNGLRPAGAPWENYVTDPGEHPDPADWRTEIYWPVAPGK